MADVRTDLREIVRMADTLPAEVVHKGIDSEAFALIGPVADPEAFEHRIMSAAMGRIDAGWLEYADGETHPLWVLGRSELLIRDLLDIDEPEGRVTVAESAAWLDGRLSTIAALEDHDWREFARDLGRCRAHMEVVLHDGEQVDQGAPCLSCGDVRLVRVWEGDEMPWEYRDGSKPHANSDGWACPKCHQSSTEAQYRFAVAATLLQKSEKLTAAQLEEGHGVKASTIRKWVERERIKAIGKDRQGRSLYSREEVIALRDADPATPSAVNA